MTARQYDSSVERAIRPSRGSGGRPTTISFHALTAFGPLVWQKSEHEYARIADAARANERRSAMKLRVYLVEDSAIMSPVLRTLIEANGARIVGNSGTAESAIQDIEVLCPDVVIIDIGLRAGSGFDVLRALFHAQTTPRPARIVLTSHALEPLRAAASRWGAAHFFDKSTQIPEMLRVLREMRCSMPAGASM
jgi:CheY-like chemotaxis protein